MYKAKSTLKMILNRIWMELRVGIMVFAAVLLFIGLTRLLSFAMMSAGVMSVESGAQMDRVAMYLGTAVLALCLIGMISRDGFRKMRTIRRDARGGAAKGVARAAEEKKARTKSR